jgi:Pullulanase N2 domain
MDAGSAAASADAVVQLQLDPAGLPRSASLKFPHLASLSTLRLPQDAVSSAPELLQGQLAVAIVSKDGKLVRATGAVTCCASPQPDASVCCVLPLHTDEAKAKVILSTALHTDMRLPDWLLHMRCHLWHATSPHSMQLMALAATGLQLPGVLDELFTYSGPLGASITDSAADVVLWAPTAQDVSCRPYACACHAFQCSRTGLPPSAAVHQQVQFRQGHKSVGMP